MRLLDKPVDKNEKNEMLTKLHKHIHTVFYSEDIDEILTALAEASDIMSLLAYSRTIKLEQE